METKEKETIEVNKNTETESEKDFEVIKRKFWRGTFIPEDKREAIREYAGNNEYIKGFLRNN